MRCDEVIKSYLDSLKEKFTVEATDSGCIIYTPYLDPSNDPLSLFIEKLNDHFRISDMTQAFEYLFLHGLEIKENSKLKWYLDITLNRLRVNLALNELFIDVSKEEIPDGILRLTEAMRSIEDLVFATKPRSNTDFGDEVADWLKEKGIPFERRKEFSGASRNVIVDFFIPRRESPALLYAMHAEGRSSANTSANRVVVNWFDLAKAGYDFYSICILDDIVDEDVWKDTYATLKTYTDRIIFWEDRDELEEVFA